MESGQSSGFRMTAPCVLGEVGEQKLPLPPLPSGEESVQEKTDISKERKRGAGKFPEAVKKPLKSAEKTGPGGKRS